MKAGSRGISCTVAISMPSRQVHDDDGGDDGADDDDADDGRGEVIVFLFPPCVHMIPC